jgi:hypothetical protein
MTDKEAQSMLDLADFLEKCGLSSFLCESIRGQVKLTTRSQDVPDGHSHLSPEEKEAYDKSEPLLMQHLKREDPLPHMPGTVDGLGKACMHGKVIQWTISAQLWTSSW